MNFKKKKLTERENKKLEIISILALIIFALASLFIKNIFTSNEPQDNISVFVNGKRITEINGIKIDINSDYTFTIGDKDFDYNTIEIKDKKVRCIDSNCKDEICVKHGYLNREVDNDMIICAPHRLLIK